MERVTVRDTSIAYTTVGLPLPASTLHFIWGHGWGQDHRIFLPLANALERSGAHTLFDFPGFGESPRPSGDWGTGDYADAFADWISTLPPKRRIWIGHSFGCRIGLQLASRHPDIVSGLFLVAAAGLPRSRTHFQKLKVGTKIAAYKALKFLPRLGVDTASLRDKFGSADYRNAGPMKSIFVKVVQENLADIASQVRCPVRLVYGALDEETPPDIGQRLTKLLPNASLSVLPRLDHYTILTAGSHQLQHQLEQFVRQMQP
jgi:pimeloyl-ACP methyl ester carboxylesterase